MKNFNLLVRESLPSTSNFMHWIIEYGAVLFMSFQNHEIRLHLDKTWDSSPP